MVIIDLDRVALDKRPALGGNLIHSTPRGYFSDVTIVHDLPPGATEEITIRLAQLVRWEAVGGSLCLTTLSSFLDLRHLPFDEFERFWSDLTLWIAAQ
jgi:hypothetical protein